ncbi:DUF1834 family protein [Salmonella enterica]|nr:DUF1834 family protein [Salmonella enterica]
MTIADIENALCDRLQRGLGVAVSDVVQWDVMTTDIGRILDCLPGAFVTFTGITDTRPHDTRRTRFRVSARFSVFVADYSLRGADAARQGDVREDEAGCYRLIHAVRRLLSGQDMGLDIGNLMPGPVRRVTGPALAGKGFALYECVFDTCWYEDALACGAWPEPTERQDDPDYVFTLWEGQRETCPAHNSTHAGWLMNGEVVAEDTTGTEKQND